MKRDILRKISTGTLLLTVAAMPFSVPACHWSFVAFIACWLAEGEWEQKWSSLTANKLALLLPSFFLLHVVGMFYTSNLTSGFAQLEKKGAFFLIPITIATANRLSRSELSWIMRVFMMACFAGTLICIGHAIWMMVTGATPGNFSDLTMGEFHRLNPGASMAWMNFSYVALASGIGMHPTYFGLYLCMCLLMIIELFRNESLSTPERVFAKILFVFFVIFILFLSSRIAMIAAIVISIAALLTMSRQSWLDVLPRQVAVVLAFAAIVYLNPVSRYRSLQEPVAASMDELAGYVTSSIEIRLSLLRLSTLASSSVNPWIGAGTGGGVDLLRAEGTQRGITNSIGSYDPHNQFIYTYFELGSVGLIVLMAVLFVPAYIAWRKRSYLYTSFAFVFIAVCLTESALELQKGIVLFTFFGSLLLFQEHQAQSGK